MRTVVFDLDGTLADTAEDMIAAANACFRALGHGDLLDPVADAATAYHGGRAMLSLGFSRLGAGGVAEVSAAFPGFISAYEADICRASRFYPGAVAAVARRKSAGDRVAVCTNKPERLALALLDALGGADMFDAVIGADTLPTRKPDPAPYRAAVARAGGDVSRSLMVGDTANDLDTARAVGVPCVLVGFGPGAATAAALGSDAMLSHFDGLDAIIARLIG